MTDTTKELSPELQRILIEAANAVRGQTRDETLKGLLQIEEAVGSGPAVTIAVELAGVALTFAAEHSSDEERRVIADGLLFLANSVLMRHPQGSA